MKTDVITKMLLLAIAVALWGLLLKPTPPVAHAQGQGALSVNIVGVGGYKVERSRLPVEVEGVQPRLVDTGTSTPNLTSIGQRWPVEVKVVE